MSGTVICPVLSEGPHIEALMAAVQPSGRDKVTLSFMLHHGKMPNIRVSRAMAETLVMSISEVLKADGERKETA